MKSDLKRWDFYVLRQWATLATILAAFFTNVLSNFYPMGGLTVGEISNQFFKPVLIIPANYAFAIWGLIYLGLISLGIYQALPAQRNHYDLRQIDYLLVIASIAQMGWMFLFQYRWFAASVAAMLLILIPLIFGYWRLKAWQKPVNRQEQWLIRIPLSIYLAWISVATIVNVAIALFSLGWNGGAIAPDIWTILMMLVATTIAFIISRPQVDLAFPLVVIWALVAIAVKQSSLGGLSVALTAAGLASGLGLFLLASRWQRRIRK